ncbi:MAG: cell wall hydrolase [Rhodobacterales bacterium]|nr:cell wall hydrolase [Rhodobacterales bacterium]
MWTWRWILVLAGIGALMLSSTMVKAQSLAESDIEKELHCLALNVYWEARSEPPEGQMAVAAVTLNRMLSDKFPDSICEVVTQGGQERNKCQFSWWCDGKKDDPTDAEAWETARVVAWLSLLKGSYDPTRGALYYHADYVKPSWSRSMRRTTRIGKHIYYLPRPRQLSVQFMPVKPGGKPLM